MKSRLLGLIIMLTLMPIVSQAQAPAGSTGQCKDGTYTSVASKSGACSGHKGVQTWYATPGKASAKTTPVASTPASSSKPATAAAPATTTSTAKPPAAAPAAPAAAQKTAAAKPAPVAPPNTGDIGSAKANGMVWVNLNTRVYHSSSDKEYGTTKNGKFMTEADAKAAGFRLAKK
jgi:hypothetical protein